MAPSAPTASRLSTLSTRTLSQILELTRSQSESLPTGSLPSQITKNLLALANGIEILERESGDDEEVTEGLKEQFERLIGLADDLGVKIEKRLTSGKLGKLVETDSGEDSSSVPLRSVPHVTISMPPEEEIHRMEEDEEDMKRANQEVLQMQQRMMDDQDDTLDSLSGAIARQHQLSLSIANELEMQEGLLDDTDSAVDRTSNSLRRASGRLDQFRRKARNTGSTGLIVALVVILLILIIVFKL